MELSIQTFIYQCKRFLTDTIMSFLFGGLQVLLTCKGDLECLFYELLDSVLKSETEFDSYMF